MGLIGHMVIRNEMGRYLADSVPWLAELTDGRMLVYDDQSTDGSAAFVAQDCRLPLVVRPEWSPSFEEDESLLRQAAWWALERSLSPTADDWVLVIDADEFVVDTDPAGDVMSVRDRLAAATIAASAVTFRVAEVFGVDDNEWPMLRTDGYWNQILAARLTKWRRDGFFHPRKEGGGSIPSSWPKASFTTKGLAILHYGYTTPEDRKAKYERYRYGKGHNRVHIDSIQRTPSLTRWVGMNPPLNRNQ